MHTPISVWIVIDTIRTFLKNFQKVSSIKWIVTELYTFVSVEFILLLHEINTNKYLKWTGKPKFRLRKLGKQIAWFICLFARAYYDLNCKNSASSSRCSIEPRLIEKAVNYNRTVIQWKRFGWDDCLWPLWTHCLLLTRFYRLCSWSTTIRSW